MNSDKNPLPYALIVELMITCDALFPDAMADITENFFIQHRVI